MPKTDNLLWLMPRAIELPLADGTAVLSKVALRAVEEMRPPGTFVRIHRSYLAARGRITGFSRTEVTLDKHGVTLPIGKKYLDDGMAQLERRV